MDLYSGRKLIRAVHLRAAMCAVIAREAQLELRPFTRIATYCERMLHRWGRDQPASTPAEDLDLSLLWKEASKMEDRLDPYTHLRIAKDLNNKETPYLCAHVDEVIEHLWVRLQEILHMLESREYRFTSMPLIPPAAMCTPPKITTLTCEVMIPGLAFNAVEFVRSVNLEPPILGFKTRIPRAQGGGILFKGGPVEGHDRWILRGFNSCVTILVARDAGIGKLPFYTAKIFCSKGKIQVTGIPSDNAATREEPFRRVREFLISALGRQLPALTGFRIHMFNTRWQILPIRRTELDVPVRVNYRRLGEVLDEMMDTHRRTGALPFAPHYGENPPTLHNYLLEQNKQRHMKIHFSIVGKNKELPLVIWPSGKCNIQGGNSRMVNAFIYGWITNVMAFHPGIVF